MEGTRACHMVSLGIILFTSPFLCCVSWIVNVETKTELQHPDFIYPVVVKIFTFFVNHPSWASGYLSLSSSTSIRLSTHHDLQFPTASLSQSTIERGFIIQFRWTFVGRLQWNRGHSSLPSATNQRRKWNLLQASDWKVIEAVRRILRQPSTRCLVWWKSWKIKKMNSMPWSTAWHRMGKYQRNAWPFKEHWMVDCKSVNRSSFGFSLPMDF